MSYYNRAVNTNDYTVGMAWVFVHNSASSGGIASIDAQIASPSYHTNFCFGNTTNVEIAPDVTYLDHFVCVNGEKRKDKTIATMKAITVNFTFDQINATNVKRFLYGGTGNAATPTFIVNASTTKEVSAEILFNTAVGRDFRYKIPRAAMKADGALTFNIDDWMKANMKLEVLECTTYKHNSLAAPYGYKMCLSIWQRIREIWVNSGKPKFSRIWQSRAKPQWAKVLWNV